MRSAPAATACPVHAATTCTGEPNSLANRVPPSVTSSSAASGPERITSRSKPPENMPGRPVTSSAPTSSPASSARDRQASSAASTSGDSVFALPWSIATRAMRSRTS
jgi:hypothetical protein